MDADIDVSVDDWPLAVRSTADRVFVDAPTLRAAAAVARSAPRSALADLDACLRVADLTVEFRVREHSVAVLGAAARPGVLSERLGVAPVELRAGGVLAAAGRTVTAVGRAIAAVFDDAGLPDGARW